MNCFQLIKTVLDDLYNEIFEEHGTCTDSIIKSKLSYLSKKYENLEDINPINIDYNDPTTRFAYVYRHTTTHANIVFQLIRDITILSNAFNTKKITVGCLGGGPGSDILGILKFLNFSSTSKNLEDLICTTYDKEQAWNETWYNVNNKIKGSFPFSTSFHFLPLDVTEPRALISTGKISDTDLFTMVYFLSEIYAYREDARDFFENLFDKARPGALLFFIDNSRRTFYDWFDQIATSNGLEIVSKKEYCSFQIEADEDKEALGYYFDNFGHPKLTAKIAYRIYRKMDGNLSWDDSDNSPF